MKTSELIQSADWKKEKHIPVIDISGTVRKGEEIKVTVSVGKEIIHPNTTEHHIAWIDVLFQPEGEKFTYHLGRFEFLSHGSSVTGPNTSTIFTKPVASLAFTTEKAGTILAVSYCNIHGLWENSARLEL